MPTVNEVLGSILILDFFKNKPYLVRIAILGPLGFKNVTCFNKIINDSSRLNVSSYIHFYVCYSLISILLHKTEYIYISSIIFE